MRLSTQPRCRLFSRASPSRCCVRARAVKENWRETARPIQPGSTYPAKENCSNCGLCDTYFVAHVKDACAFLGDGMSKIERLEEQVHGRSRDLDNWDDIHFGVHEEMLYARNVEPIQGAQWTGIVTKIAISMLESGAVDAVVCVQSDENDRFQPKPFVATCREDIIKARGVKPCLSPNLSVLATVEALQVEKLLFIGVGCQVQALRSVEKYLPCKKVYVLGTNCVDNGPRKGLDKFLKTASKDPDTVLHYEFMQDYRVHIKHQDGTFEKIPYFSLPGNELNDVIAPSCYSCFDYPNALADLVVGYMGVPYGKVNMTEHLQYVTSTSKETGADFVVCYMGVPYGKVNMAEHLQYVTVRNERGRELLESIRPGLETQPTMSIGDRKQFVLQTVLQDDEGKMGRAPDPMPIWLGNILAWVLEKVGPKGLEFGRYSLDYHVVRNFIHVNRNWKAGRAEEHIPAFARKIVEQYNKDGVVTKRIKIKN